MNGINLSKMVIRTVIDFIEAEAARMGFQDAG